jgi:hypothetical protein
MLLFEIRQIVHRTRLIICRSNPFSRRIKQQ